MNKVAEAITYLQQNMSWTENGSHFSVAIEALTKQMPTQPIKEKNDYRCGKCHHLVGIQHSLNRYQSEYCPHCGQLMDWKNIQLE